MVIQRRRIRDDGDDVPNLLRSLLPSSSSIRGFAQSSSSAASSSSSLEETGDDDAPQSQPTPPPPPRAVYRSLYMKDCKSMEELVRLAYSHVDDMSPRSISLFWNYVSIFLRKQQQQHQRNRRRSAGMSSSSGKNNAQDEYDDAYHRLDMILVRTLEDIENFGDMKEFGTRDLVTVALSLAKIVKIVDGNNPRARGRGERRAAGGGQHWDRILRDLLIGKNGGDTKRFIFHHIAWALTKPPIVLGEVVEEPRLLSNLIYAYAIAECVPVIEEGRTFFDIFAEAAIPSLGEFEPQHLSNTAWAYAKARSRNPHLFEKVGDVVASMENLDGFEAQTFSNLLWAYTAMRMPHPELFEKVADHVVALDYLDSFVGQDYTNILRAYAIVAREGSRHPKLFERIADHIVRFDDLESFGPQHLSNVPWAYATAGESHPRLFEKLADHVASLANLDRFKPREISQILWSYATAKESHQPRLFQKIADHITGMGSLGAFGPRDLSSILWAFAATGESHPGIFEKVADHVVALDDAGAFFPQDVSQILWACATAKEFQPRLFQKLSDAAIARQSEFNPQDVANFLWACATNGHVDHDLFSSFVPSAKAKVGKFNSQEMANLSWAYAVADVAAPTLFDDDFINTCLDEKHEFNTENFSQLYQWHLWQQESKSKLRLPPALEEKCYESFISDELTSSPFQDDVISTLSRLGLRPEEETLTEKGYRLDALVKVGGNRIGVEADGPYHFVGRWPNGSTILKHRQVANLEGIKLVSVPYWDWQELGKDDDKKQKYLQTLLDVS